MGEFSGQSRAEGRLQAHGHPGWLTQMLALDHCVTGATFGPLYLRSSLNWKLVLLKECQRVKFELGMCRRGWQWPEAPAVADKCGDQAESGLWFPHYRGGGESQACFPGEHWKDHPFQTRLSAYSGAQRLPLMLRATTTNTQTWWHSASEILEARSLESRCQHAFGSFWRQNIHAMPLCQLLLASGNLWHLLTCRHMAFIFFPSIFTWPSFLCLFLFCFLSLDTVFPLKQGVVQSLSHVWLFVTPWTTAL